MSLTGMKFFGCTVKNISSSVGLENQKTSVRISLVEDAALGDLFAPVVVGTPASIEIGNLRFTGLLQRYERTAGSDGRYVYDVVLEDPRDILDGCTVILNNYEGSVDGVPNLLNVYGYWENTGFGNSLSNQAGMPWTLIKSAIQTMTTAGTVFGGPLVYKGISYSVNLGNLPSTLSNYRLGGDSTTLLQLISEVCHERAHDFIVELEYGTNIINIKTVSRYLQPSPGLLSAYIAAQTESGICIRSNIGVEARNETCSKFLVGGQETLFHQTSDAIPFFGFDENGEPIIGTYADDTDPFSLTANLNALEVADILGQNTYTCTSLEFAAADIDMDNWLRYIDAVRPTIANLLGTRTAIRANLEIQQLANVGQFNLGGGNAAALADAATINLNSWKTQRLYNFVKKTSSEYFGKKYIVSVPQIQAVIEPETGNINQNYDIVNLAYSASPPLGLNTAYTNVMGDGRGRYGAYCKYNPACYLKLVQTTQEWSTPTGIVIDDGTLESTVTDNGVVTEIYSQVLNPAITSDNVSFLFRVYHTPAGNDPHRVEDSMTGMRQINGGALRPQGLGEVSFNFPDENNVPNEFTLYTYIISNNGQRKLYLKFVYNEANTITPITLTDYTKFKLIEKSSFLDISEICDLSRLSPDSYIYDSTSNGIYVKTDVNPTIYQQDSISYVVVTIPNPVHMMPLSSYGIGIADVIRIRGLPDNANNRAALARVDQNWAAGGAIIKTKNYPMAPLSFAIPLQNNLRAYGPWYAVGALGKVEYEQDPTLNPWDCGGVSMMNSIAIAKVSQALSFQQQAETGSFELVGMPAFNIGDAAVTGGPNISSIDVGYGPNGVTTTYRFHTFSNRFGQITKNMLEQQRRIIKGKDNLAKQVSQLNADKNKKKLATANQGVGYIAEQAAQFGGAFIHRSPVNAITMYADECPSGSGTVITQGGILPMIEVTPALRANDYELFNNTACASVDAIFRPFSTDSSHSGMAKYVEVSATYNHALTVSNLDPFQSGNDIQVLLSSDIATDNSDLETILQDVDLNNYNGSGVINPNKQRPIALRGPLILSSWGWSVDDGPTPNTSSDYSGGYVDDYLNKSNLWATGPVELLWDGERGVWTSQGHCMGYAQTGIPPLGEGRVVLMETPSNNVVGRTAQNRTVKNLFTGEIPAGEQVISVWIPEAKSWYAVACNNQFKRYNWVDIQTSDYQASAWDAIPMRPSGIGTIVRLPSVSGTELAKDDRVLIEILEDAPYTTALNSGPDDSPIKKINGKLPTGEHLLDGPGYWEAIWTADEDIGWVISRPFSNETHRLYSYSGIDGSNYNESILEIRNPDPSGFEPYFDYSSAGKDSGVDYNAYLRGRMNGKKWSIILEASGGSSPIDTEPSYAIKHGGTTYYGDTASIDGISVKGGLVVDMSGYSPSAPGNWSGTPPTGVWEALDRIAAAYPGVF